MICLRPSQNGVDECRASRTKVESGQSSAIRRLYQRLIFGGGEKQLIGAVAVVVERLNTRCQAARRLLVRYELGANQASPKLRTQVRSIQTAEHSVPVSIVALRPQQK